MDFNCSRRPFFRTKMSSTNPLFNNGIIEDVSVLKKGLREQLNAPIALSALNVLKIKFSFEHSK